jgi:hypothetical protein
VRFKIGETLYDGANLDRLSLKDILLLENATEALGRPLKWHEIQQWTEELDRLAMAAAHGINKAARDAAMEERNRHPGNIWVMALVIWASRRLAGESISFEDAIDFPMADLEFLPDPKDERAANPTKARPTPKGSGRAAKPRPARSKTT